MNLPKMKRVVHIAPALPPAINGLGDFCKILADSLEEKGVADNVFMIMNRNGSLQSSKENTFSPYTFSRILDQQIADVVMLHYVGYAYDKRGIPYYIVRALQKYKSMTRCRVLVFFHELYASSNSIFELPFYTHWFQKLIVKQLIKIADTAFTNCTPYNEMLNHLSVKNRSSAVCTGIFSNVPDHLYDHTIEKDENALVVFGSLHKRVAVYRNALFPALLEALAIKTIYDIGPGESDFHDRKVKFMMKGTLSHFELAGYLNMSKFGALSYKPHLIGKSGIFSAYAAFGVIAFNLEKPGGPLHEGLVHGRNYFTFRTDVRPANFDANVREEILKWYRTRNQQAVAAKIEIYI